MPLEPNPDFSSDEGTTGVTMRGDFSGRQFETLTIEDSHIVRSSFVAADLRRLAGRV